MNENNINPMEEFNKILPMPTAPQTIVGSVNQNLTPPNQTNSQNIQKTDTVNDVKIVDNDLIEKVWVDKIKMIIRQTRGNPFKRADDINKLKAEYMLKEHNRIIKTK